MDRESLLQIFCTRGENPLHPSQHLFPVHPPIFICRGKKGKNSSKFPPARATTGTQKGVKKQLRDVLLRAVVFSIHRQSIGNFCRFRQRTKSSADQQNISFFFFLPENMGCRLAFFRLSICHAQITPFLNSTIEDSAFFPCANHGTTLLIHFV